MLTSVTIPTYNSSATLGTCIEAIQKNEVDEKPEIIVVDSYSTDNTVEIAESFGAKVFLTKQKLLGARYEGFKKSSGKYVLLLDADQILGKKSISRALKMFEENDMLCLEEHSYMPRTWIQRLFEADRRLIHNLSGIHLDPIEGVLLARFYKREILRKAFSAIPKEIMPITVAHDHAIIYYEAYRVSQRVGILPNAVWHIEPASLIRLWKKNYRYGGTTRDFIDIGVYDELLRRKVRFRKGSLSRENFKYGIQSMILLLLKGLAYQLGYWFG